jgi:hypothetical protein
VRPQLAALLTTGYGTTGPSEAVEALPEMHLFELAYCCRLYGERTGFDVALARFLEGTGGAVDLTIARHRALTLQWLRDWGCRSLRRDDDRRTSSALRVWWRRWGDALPAADLTLDALNDDALETAAAAYGDLSTRTGPRRQLADRLIDVRFGPTTAAKTMFAVRPQTFLPWDNAIRKELGYDGSAVSYRNALVRARSELAEAVAQAGVATRALPELIGRPTSPPPKLIDEHDWIRYAQGHSPPTREELDRWRRWHRARRR